MVAMTLARKARFFYIFLALALLVAPFMGAYPILVMKLICFALFACAFNLLLGFTGLLSFGHAAFFGGAAYLTGHALKVWGLSPEIGLLVGTLGATFLGVLVGLLAIRRQGIYFAMITLALAQMLYFFCLQAPATGGEDGLQGVPRGKLFGIIGLENDLTMYYVAVFIAIAVFLFIKRIIHSPFGQILKAIKENEARAISLGYDVQHFKLLAFALSAGLAGLAGSLKVLILGFATLSDVHWSNSGQVILMTLVGGVGTFAGPVVGASVVVAIENKLGELGSWLASLTGIEWFGTLGESVSIMMGLIFVVCVMVFRRGVVGEIVAFLSRREITPSPPHETNSSSHSAEGAPPTKPASATQNG